LYLQLLPEIPEDSKLRQEWNTLVQQMERPEIFYTYEWALAMQRAYGTAAQPLLALAYEDGRLRGVAALAADPARQDFSFLAATTADYCDFVSAPGDQSSRIFSPNCVVERRAGFGSRICRRTPPVQQS